MPENQIDSDTAALDDPKTKWAYERTILANERTYIAWLRTGLAITGGSALFVRLLEDVEPAWLVDFVSIVMGLVGALIVVMSTWGYRKMHQKLDQIDPSFFPNWMVILIVVALEMAMIAFLILFLVG